MAYDTVPCGRYRGKTKAEIEALITALQTEDAAAPGSAGVVVEMAMNGRSVKYDPRFGPASFAARMAELEEALAFVDDTALAITDKQVATMRGGTIVIPSTAIYY